jgi:nucleotide-binding universal stress UspA family protein
MPVSIAGTNGLLIRDPILPDSTILLGFQRCSGARATAGSSLGAQEHGRMIPIGLKGRQTMQDIKLLVVVDETKASKRAVSYVAHIVGRRRRFKVCLVHALSELPASLIEYGGAQNPDEEEKLDGELHTEQKRWVFASQEKAQPALTRACAVLRKGGLAAGAIEEQFCYPADGRARGDEILELARKHKCHTVVVRSDSLSWLRQLLGSDPVEELLRRGKGFTIWIVE